jgi:hypothetical protein
MCCFGFTKLLYTHTCLPLVMPTKVVSARTGHAPCAHAPVHARNACSGLGGRFPGRALQPWGPPWVSRPRPSRPVSSRACAGFWPRQSRRCSFLAAPPSSRPSAYHQRRPTLSSSSSNPSARRQSTNTPVSPATRPPPLSAFMRWQKQGRPWMQGAAKHHRRHFLRPFQPPEWNPRWARITPPSFHGQERPSPSRIPAIPVAGHDQGLHCEVWVLLRG